MAKYHNEILQNSDEWYQIRLGKFTASDFHVMLGKSQTKTDRLWEVIAERIFKDTDQENFATFAMERGRILESEARRAYTIENEVNVDVTGFVESDDEYADFVGCSPDGLVGDDGLIEIKCPLAKNFLQWTEPTDEGRQVKYIKPEYYTQIQFNLLVTGRQWIDFCYYHPRAGLVVKRYYPDPEHIAKIKAALDECIAFVCAQTGEPNPLQPKE